MSSLSSAGLAGFALSCSLIAAIGAQNMFVLQQGLRRNHVGPIIMFCAICDAALISLGVSGMGALVHVAPAMLSLMTYGGAAFLAWYGLSALRRAIRSGGMETDGAPPLPLGKALAKTAAFTFLNPHVYLDTVLLMGAAGSAQPLDARPAFVVGAALASLLWFVSLGYGARVLAPVLARPAAWRVLDCVVGVAMLAMALNLVARAAQSA
ncbi:LysE/ArgO family amino acid transporter [Acetobacter sp. DsW_063]|uniref:LysE/ArgO family amino acid transporter n=1 Tax=Acetobacter sp. DsW_063 TaxID=1514894 RepID=UPI000A35E7A1|nr:LysE/ArgO family amino acid transporter [Acetobacter sp. DsW_063]OUJ14336.1 amino acid transporter [Acetobacter sp. DsW_063]